MQLTVKGKHLDVGDALREHVRASLAHTTKKYFRDPIDAMVVFTKEKGHRYRTNITIHVRSGIMLEAHFEANDPYVAFDEASRRVATRLRRYKDKLNEHHRREDNSDKHMAAYTTFEANENKPGPAIIAEMEAHVPTLAVSDAVMRLELGDLPALMFKNPANDSYNLVYRRKDGNIGWIDPATPAPKKKAKKAVKKSTVKKAKPAKKPPAKKTAAKKATARKAVGKTKRQSRK